MKLTIKQILMRSIRVALALNILCGALCTSVFAGNIDIYIAYSGKNKETMKTLKQAFQSHLTVKSYNVDLLALADYTGKQKAIAKLESADLIVIISDAAMESLSGTSLNTDLLVLQSLKATVTSSKVDLRIVKKGTNLDRQLKTHAVASENDLNDISLLHSFDVLVVDETSIDIHKGVALVAAKLLGK